MKPWPTYSPRVWPSNPVKTIVLGGYGNFGARICRALANTPGIDLVVAGRGGRQRDPIALGLERTGGVDHQCRAMLQQDLGELGIGDVDGSRPGAAFLGQGACTGQVAAGDDQIDPGRVGEGAANAGTEVPVTTQDDGFHVTWRDPWRARRPRPH